VVVKLDPLPNFTLNNLNAEYHEGTTLRLLVPEKQCSRLRRSKVRMK